MVNVESNGLEFGQMNSPTRDGYVLMKRCVVLSSSEMTENSRTEETAYERGVTREDSVTQLRRTV